MNLIQITVITNILLITTSYSTVYTVEFKEAQNLCVAK